MDYFVGLLPCLIHETESHFALLSVYEVSKPAIANDHLIWHRRKGKIIGAVQNQ